MKYLITGITGFVGPHLAQLLYDNGHKVYGLSRRCNGMESDILDVVSKKCYDSIEFISCDLTNKYAVFDVFKKYQFDGVFHLAAQSHPAKSFDMPYHTMMVNVMGSLNLIDAVQRLQPYCKFHFCSTSEVVGNSNDGNELTKETAPFVPSNPYGASKAMIDMHMQERMQNDCIRGFITRAYSHTGPRRGKIFSISSDAYQIAKMMVNKKPENLLVGNLETTRVVIDVRDVANAYYLLMISKRSFGQIFNICGDIPQKMEYFTNKMIKMSGYDIKKVIYDKYYRKIDINYQHGDTTKIKEMIGWEAKISIDQTLQDLLNYWIKKLT